MTESVDIAKTIWHGLRGFWRAEGTRFGASTAFYAIFSMAPILVIAVSIVALMFDADPARQRGLVAGTIAAVALMIGATAVFSELRNALNRIINARRRFENPVVAFVRVRVLAFSLVLTLGFLALTSLLVSSALEAISQRFQPAFGSWLLLFQVVSTTLSLAAVTLVCAAIYRWLPDERLAWRPLLYGAAVSALLFSIGKWAIGIYLGGSGTASAYGAAGSFVVLIIWVYFTALSFLLGASIAAAFARRRPGGYASGSGKAVR